jgi:hypothetical protein
MGHLRGERVSKDEKKRNIKNKHTGEAKHGTKVKCRRERRKAERKTIRVLG